MPGRVRLHRGIAFWSDFATCVQMTLREEIGQSMSTLACMLVLG